MMFQREPDKRSNRNSHKDHTGTHKIVGRQSHTLERKELHIKHSEWLLKVEAHHASVGTSTMIAKKQSDPISPTPTRLVEAGEGRNWNANDAVDSCKDNPSWSMPASIDLMTIHGWLPLKHGLISYLWALSCAWNTLPEPDKPAHHLLSLFRRQ